MQTNEKNGLNEEIKREIAFFAICGLISGILKPRSKAEFVEAHRVIFDRNSLELKQLAALLNTDSEKIQKEIFATLTAAGFPCDTERKY